MEYIIETNAVTKRYGAQKAVDKVSLRVRKGEIYGLIGKNGAGKTTLMKLILGLCNPNEGEIRLFGGVDLPKARRRTGALVEIPALYLNCSAYENMIRFGYLSGATKEEIEELLTLVGLQNAAKKKVSQFSLGMKQRLGIAVALLGSPELLILDEPVNGLDPAGIKEIRDLLVDLSSRGVTILVSSHLLDELGRIATTFGIMRNGQLVEEITAAELTKQCRSMLEVITSDGEEALKALFAWRPDLEVQRTYNKLRIASKIEDPSEVNLILTGAGLRVYELKTVYANPETYFIERMG